MNSYIRKTVLATALVFAALCVQSCTKNGMTPEERLIERRERTFSNKKEILSFYLDGKLVCDWATWERCNNNWLVELGRPQVYYKKRKGEDTLFVFADATNHSWTLTNEDIDIGCISFDIPYKDDKFLLDSIKVEASFHKERVTFYDCPLSVSSMDFEIVEYDEGDSENRGYMMGRFSFNARYDFGGYEDWPESVEFSITDGMFCAYYF